MAAAMARTQARHPGAPPARTQARQPGARPAQTHSRPFAKRFGKLVIGNPNPGSGLEMGCAIVLLALFLLFLVFIAELAR